MKVCVVGAGSAIAQGFARYHPEHQVYLTNRLDVIDLAATEETFSSLVVCIGYEGQAVTLRKMREPMWETTVKANLTSVFEPLRYMLPKVADGGSVVVVGSIVGSTGGYGCAGYAAAKAGLVGLVRAAANEEARRGVCVNLLELGYVNAGMGARLPDAVREKVLGIIPLKRFAQLEEAAAAINFLVTTRYMTGNTLTFAGGLR